MNEAACGWGMRPGSLATAKACTRIFQPDGQEYLQSWLAYQAELWYKAYYRGLFRKSGLLSPDHKDDPSLFEKAAEHVSPTLFSEVTPTVDDGLEAESNGYDGIILIGPFNCLPFRISEAILKPLSLQRGMPLLAYESDGYAVAPSSLAYQVVRPHPASAGAHAAHFRGCPDRHRQWGIGRIPLVAVAASFKGNLRRRNRAVPGKTSEDTSTMSI